MTSVKSSVGPVRMRLQMRHSKVRRWAPNMDPLGFLGTLKGTYRVYSRYIRIPGLSSHTRAHGFNLGLEGPSSYEHGGGIILRTLPGG